MVCLMFSLVDAATWAGLGVAATLLTALVAERSGFLQISLMRQAHSLNVAKAVPKIGCSVIATEKPDLGPGYNPHIYLTLELYNEGELAVEKVNGLWKYLPAYLGEKFVREIHWDFLGKCERRTDTRRIDESANWHRQGVSFDVDVEFIYRVPGENQPCQYIAKYRYAKESRQMIKVDQYYS
jgi:hypothetical protein